MNRSTKTRYIIFQILVEIFKKNKNFETVFNKIIIGQDFNQRDISFINNVCLNTMRRNIHCKLILNKFIKSKLNTNHVHTFIICYSSNCLFKNKTLCGC